MTEYRIALTPADYKKCHELLDAVGRTITSPLSFPTICAFRGDEMVGFISLRHPKKAKAIVLNELVVHPSIKRPQFVIARLIYLLEQFLADRGIVSYLFCIPLAMQDWIDRIGELGMKPYTKDSKVAWFHRRFA